MPPRDYHSLSGPKRLGDRLLEAGLVTRTQLDQALEQQGTSSPRVRLGRVLTALGAVSERDLAQMLSVHFAIPLAPFPIADAEPRAVALLPAAVARRHRMLPCRVVAGALRVVVADPPPAALIETLRRASGLPVVVNLAPEPDVDAAVARHYADAGPTLAARLRELAEKVEHLDGDDGHVRAETERLCAEIEALLHCGPIPSTERAPWRTTS